jgi:hypothetical protein
MKRVIIFLIAVFVLIFSSCQKKTSETLPKSHNTPNSTRDTVSVVQLSKSPKADTLYVDLKVLDPEGKKEFYKLDKSKVTVLEDGTNNPNIVTKVNSVIDIRDKRVISDQLSMLFLIDRSGSIA